MHTTYLKPALGGRGVKMMGEQEEEEQYWTLDSKAAV